MDKYVSIVLGLILMLIPIYLSIANVWQIGTAALILLKGGIAWIVLLVGLVLIMTGLMGLKED